MAEPRAVLVAFWLGIEVASHDQLGACGTF